MEKKKDRNSRDKHNKNGHFFEDYEMLACILPFRRLDGLVNRTCTARVGQLLLLSDPCSAGHSGGQSVYATVH